MKFLIAASLLLVGSAAFAKTTITVQCACTYYAEYLIRSTLATGTSTASSAEEIAECQIVNGKVISGCGAAKWNARYNCEQQVVRFTGQDMFNRPQVSIDENICYGKISND